MPYRVDRPATVPATAEAIRGAIRVAAADGACCVPFSTKKAALERNGFGTAPTTHSPPNRAILVRLRNIILRYPRSLLAGTSVALMNDVTRILSAIEQGDPKAAGQLLPLIYD